MMTYTVPFFGYDHKKEEYFFKQEIQEYNTKISITLLNFPLKQHDLFNSYGDFFWIGRILLNGAIPCHGFGLNKQVGTTNHCLGSRIFPDMLIFHPQVEKNECDTFYFLIKVKWMIKIKRKLISYVCHFHEVHLNGINLKTLLLKIL